MREVKNNQSRLVENRVLGGMSLEKNREKKLDYIMYLNLSRRDF